MNGQRKGEAVRREWTNGKRGIVVDDARSSVSQRASMSALECATGRSETSTPGGMGPQAGSGGRVGAGGGVDFFPMACATGPSTARQETATMAATAAGLKRNVIGNPLVIFSKHKTMEQAVCRASAEGRVSHLIGLGDLPARRTCWKAGYCQKPRQFGVDSYR